VLARSLSAVVTLLLFLGLGGCSNPEPLRLGLNPWIGSETLALAQQFGWLPQAVQVVETASMGESAAGLVEGQLDAALLTLDEMLLLRERGTPLTAVLVFDVSAGGDALLAKPQFPKLTRLRGRTVGVERSALGLLILSHALDSVGMTTADVVIAVLSPEEQLQAWKNGQIDAAVTYGPTLSALESSFGRRLFDSEQMPNLIVDVLAVRQDRLDHPALPGVVRAHFQGLDQLQHHQDDAIYRIAANLELSPSGVRRALAHL
jgi:NitT/TauT family transport system substrate-binding protein